jgi:hypothetical protein
MKKKKASATLIYLLCLVPVLLIYTYAVYFPLSARNAELDAQHTQNQIQMENEREQLSKTKVITDKIAALQKKLDASKKDAPTDGSRIAEDVSKAFGAVGIIPQEVQAGSEIAASAAQSASGSTARLMTVPVTVKTVCTQGQARQLLNYFEKQSSGCYYADSVQFAQNKQKGDVYSVTISLSLYYYGTGAKAK